MSEASVEIRPCGLEDIQETLALWIRAGAVPRPTDHPEALKKRLKRDRELFLIATDGGRVVASLMGGWDGWRGNMYRLAVDPQFRGLGLARQLIEEVESRLRQLGAERITSLVFKDDPAAVSVWTSAGYARDPAIERYSKDLK